MDNISMKPLYISTAEAAERYSLSKSTIRRLFEEPDFPAVLRVGYRICIPLDAFDEYMKKFIECKTSDEA